MHELSVAHALVGTVTRALDGREGAVREVHISVGELSGIVPQALEFAYDVATEGTRLQGSTLVVEPIAVAVHCHACDADGELEQAWVFRCPSCGEPTADVRRGRELDLTSVVLDDEPVLEPVT